uniref:Copia protein n=1 Tax=Tanacetum cinerariifolium TaxID=118510 RepID=A0A6L2JQT3_TANCI|nr:copia protein [Tanacetum cinerariifolium]
MDPPKALDGSRRWRIHGSYVCDFPSLAKNKVTQILEVVPFEEKSDDLKKKLAKNREAKMVLYNALPKKEYERIFMCKTAKDILQSFFNHTSRFNNIISSLKALDEGFSSKNYVRKFLRALHPKWRSKVTIIEELKDLSSLALDELIGNLKVHEVVMEKDFEIYRGKNEKVKSIALKAMKESSNDETLTSRSDDEEYAMAVRNFKKFFRRKGNGIRKNGLYVMKLGNKSQDKLCLTTVVVNSTLCHRRLGYANMRVIQSLSSKELVRNLPKLRYGKHFCDACKIGKQTHASHKAKNMVSTKRCLELLHMDLFGPSVIKSYGGNLYTLVVVDDYSRYTWIRFLKTKNEAFEKFDILSRKIQNQLGRSIIDIRTDHGREFDNEVQFGAYCDAQGITHNFPASRTPLSDGVVERKNRTLQEMSRTMLNEQFILQTFWCNAVDTSTYILNRILIRPILGKTPYEIFRDKNGIVSRNKARLVAQGYNQQEGIDYNETYALIARLDSIRILLVVACANDFKLYQMDVKSVFLNGFINEEVYVAQPPGFTDFLKPNYVYKLKKALYGLKQSPKAWYDRLKAFLIKHEYSMGMADNTLFTKKSKSLLIIVQIYVDDIIFGSTSQNLCDDFAKIMHDKFKMSMMGELNFFLGLQIKQMKDEIFFNQSKYVKEMLKKFGLEDSKPTKTLMSTEIKLTKEDEVDSVDSSKYRENPKNTYLEAVKRIFSNYFGLKHDIIKKAITTPRTTQAQLLRDPNKLYIDDIHHDLKGWELFFKEKIVCSINKRNKVKACTAYMLYYLTIRRKFNFTSMIIYRMEDVITKSKGPMPFSMLLACLYNHILATNPQAIVLIARFTFHEHVMDPLDISRNRSTEKGKKIASPLFISSSSLSSDDNEAPTFLEFYDQLSDSEDLTKAQREKRGMFKCLNRYVGTITKYLEKQK